MDTLAIRYGAGGMPDNRAPRHVHAMIRAGTALLVTAMFLMIPRLTFAPPPRCINRPNKDYWLHGASVGSTVVQ